MASTPIPDSSRDLIFQITTSEPVAGTNLVVDPQTGSESATADLSPVEIALAENVASETVSAEAYLTLYPKAQTAREVASASLSSVQISLAEMTADESASAEAEVEGGLATRTMVFFGRYKVYNSEKLGEVALRKLSWLRGETR